MTRQLYIIVTNTNADEFALSIGARMREGYLTTGALTIAQGNPDRYVQAMIYHADQDPESDVYWMKQPSLSTLRAAHVAAMGGA